MLLFGKKLSEENLIGTWKHPLLASWVNINGSPSYNYHDEIFVFKADKTFTFGEYGKSGALFEEKGTWKLSIDKTKIELTYESGEHSSIDIRKFNGSSFITTSIQGNDFVFKKG